jgi:hypothetical protein
VNKKLLTIDCLLTIALASPVKALPPVDDRPEEVLRGEIITDARSPLYGESLSAGQYQELLVALAREDRGRISNPGILNTVRLLRIRALLRTFGFPIKAGSLK